METSDKGGALSDSRKALLAALILDGFTVLVVFGFPPGGFETQGLWLLVLLPATLAAYPFSDMVYQHAPYAGRVVFWTAVISFNFLWYWLLSSIVIKARRALS
jgi:hypothetical protein